MKVVKFSTSKVWTILILCFALLSLPVLAQDDTVTVPDVTGLNVAQATALLNSTGLTAGKEIPVPIMTQSEQIAGMIESQSIAADEQVAYGTAIDLNIYSSAHITLIYDDNDFTVINHSGVTLGLDNFIFNSDDGTHRFLASRWQPELETGDCGQIWSIARFEPKSVEGCDSIHWITSNDPVDHFWTQLADVNSFDVLENSTSRITCPAAPPNSQDSPTTCDFYIVTFTDLPATEYLYFAYTEDRFAVINSTDDSWMPVNQTPLYTSTNPDTSLLVSNFFTSNDMLANPERLAPGQCFLLTTDSNIIDAPEPCTVAGNQVLDSGSVFWRASFELDSPFDRGERISCPAANSGQITLCIMPQ